jgi:type I restriction enzyme S subunit
MRLNYKRLGDYIQPINQRNVNLEVETLLGVSIRKVLMPSIANTIGTDMSRYKIIKKNQFAYGPVTSRNGDKISIALLEEHDKALLSQAYTVFEIIDNDALNAEYLMMWFRRPEFDRYARFKSHGSARETFDWNELEDTELPIPSIDKQREIVKEYNTIVNRITLNETLNQKLEDTAQALYKHWFVDFEFPNAEGKPYKSSGGEMVYNEELDIEIPLGWENKSLGEICFISAGGDKPKDFSKNKKDDFVVPIYSNSSKNNGLYGYTKKAKILSKSITISARGAIIGYTVLRVEPFVPIVRLIVVTPKDEYYLNYVFNTIKDFRYNDTASAQGQLTVPEISSFNLLYPDSVIMNKYQNVNFNLIEFIHLKKSEVIKLETLKSIILSKMSKVETKTVEA